MTSHDPMEQTARDAPSSGSRITEAAYFPSTELPGAARRVKTPPTLETDDRERWGVPQPSHRREKQGNRWLVPMLIAIAVLAIGAIGVVAFALGSTGHKPSPKTPPTIALSQLPAPPPVTTRPSRSKPSSPAPTSPSADGTAQASAVNAVLAASSATRQEVVNTNLTTCEGLAAAAPTLQKVVSERQSELQKAQNAAVDQLSGGSDLHTALVNAMQYSLKADQAYLAWAKSAKGCKGTPPANSDSRNADTMNSQAGLAKQRFLQLWGPIAQADGFPAYTDGNI